MRIAVVGLGSMGLGAACSLLRGGHDVLGVDRSAAAREAFVAAGGRAAGDVSEAPAGLDALVLFVVNEAQATDVLFGADGLGRVGQGGLLVNCVTMAPDGARRLAARVEERGARYLDAPVSGGPARARDGSMTVMASGAPEAFEAAGPLLAAMAGTVWRLGAQAGAGSTVKMVNQLLAGVHIAAAAEAMALGIRAGADPQTLFEVISGSAGSSWMWQNRMPHVLAGDDTPLSAVNIFVKDLGIVLDQARSLTFPLPLAANAHQLFLAAAAGGHGGRDDAFVIRVWEALAGIALPGG